MTEIIFLFEEDPEGGYIARAINEAIFTQDDTLEELRENSFVMPCSATLMMPRVCIYSICNLQSPI